MSLTKSSKRALLAKGRNNQPCTALLSPEFILEEAKVLYKNTTVVAMTLLFTSILTV